MATSDSTAFIDDVLARDKTMPIAIIGMACRFPGDATSPEKLWNMLAEKRSGWCEIPKDRFNIDAFYHPDPDRNGTFNVRAGHFLKGDIAAWDAPFFSTSPAEANAIDPQQRLVLESAYECLENAGIPMERVAGTNTSCFLGCFSRDYNELLSRDPETAPVYVSTGNGAAILSNRISYFFDLKGPSLTIDTACSSSLVALYLACQSIRDGHSSASIVAGTNLIFSPDVMIAMSNVHFLGPDARCFTYDSRSNGYARGEGIATILLKPLQDAIRDNDTIRAVIRGVASNQDGRTAGIMLPSRAAQEELIRTAYKESGCDPAEVGYFEAHGTGTPAGDPLEAGAIGATLGVHCASADVTDRLYVGSVKTNIGHLEGASGLAGVIKTVLSLEKGAIPPNLWFEKPNERIDLEGWRIQVPTDLIPWPKPGIRRASINSFGFGGSNAHVILDDAYHYLASHGLTGSHCTSPTPAALSLLKSSYGMGSSSSAPSDSEEGYGSAEDESQILLKRRFRIFLWATHEEGIAKNNAQSYADHLESRKYKNEVDFLDDLSYTLCSRRSMLPLRCFIVAHTIRDLVTKLRNSRQKPIRAESQNPRLGFIFTGQGAQWWRMGRELLAMYSTFERTIRAADDAVRSFGASWSLYDELTKDAPDSKINDSAISQPICTAVQLALCKLLFDWGVRPERVIGHSSGEIAAAYAAGILPFEAAMKVSYFRGVHSDRVANELGLEGAMLAVGLSEDEAKEWINKLPQTVERCAKHSVIIACVNSPSNVTISGNRKSIEVMERLLKQEHIFVRKLKVNTAYHSHHMKSIADDYQQSLTNLEEAIIPETQRPDVDMISTVTGASVQGDCLGAEYWVQNLLSCVRFSDALQELCTANSNRSGKRQRGMASRRAVDILIELGPHSALAGPVKQILGATPQLSKSDIAYHSALVRDRDACETMLELAASLFARGCAVNINNINFPADDGSKFSRRPQVLVDLPSYPWNHNKRYWAESRLSLDYRFREEPRNDFLGAQTMDWNPIEPRWRNFIRIAEQPWVKAHRVQESIVYPAAGYIVMAVEAARRIVPYTERKHVVGFNIRELTISRALVIPQTDTGVEVMFHMRPFNSSSKSLSDTWMDFRVFSWAAPSSGWNEHCRGLISVVYQRSPNEVDAGKERQEAQKTYAHRLGDAVQSCTQPMQSQQIYQELGKAGLNYGPCFCNLSEVFHGIGQAVGVIRIPDTKSLMPYEYEHEHLVHPATMDSFLQTLFPALIHANQDVKEPYMPTSIDEIFISSHISSVPDHKFRGTSRAAFTGFREADADILIFDDDDQSMPVVRINRVRCTALTAGMSMVEADAADASMDTKRICFNVSWEPDLDLLSKDQNDQILNQTGIEDTSSDYIAVLELVSYYFYEQVLRNITDSEVASMHPHHQKYFRYMQHMRENVQAGRVEHQTPEWLQLDAPEMQTKMEQLIQKIEKTDYEGQLLCRMGRNLIRVLRKEVEPLALMLQDELLYNYYASSLGIATSYAQLGKFITLLINKNPDLEFIEIGAGTGGATVPILNALGGNKGAYPRFKSYTYTDVSTGFFEKAEEKFKDWKPLLQFGRLDIEADPIVQGYEEGRYDVVMAFNVLHATKSIDKTVANVRKLMKPGGKLLLLEITHVLNRNFLIFGTLPGWWASEENWREWGPTMSEETWRSVLKRNGFSDLKSSTPDHQNPRDQTGRLMISVAIEPTNQARLMSLASVLVVISDAATDGKEQNNLALKIAQRLHEKGYEVQIVSMSQMHGFDVQGKIVLSMVELETPLMQDINQRDFDALKEVMHHSAGLLWITVGATQDTPRPHLSLFHGLARTLRAEKEALPLVTLDISEETVRNESRFVNNIYQIFDQMTDPWCSKEEEYSEKDGILFVKRCIEAPDLNSHIARQTGTLASAPELGPFYQPDRPLTLAIQTPGLLDTLYFDDDFSLRENLDPDSVEIEVKAVGLNFRDIMVSMGQLTDDFLGCECSGVITQVGTNVKHLQVGDRVATWTLGAYCSYLRNPGALVQPIPLNMEYHVAASIPIVYCTAYYGLLEIARLHRGEIVLIHAAAGGVGQAAITLAQHIGAEIFVTVGTMEKKKHVIDTYGIPEDHIFSSRDLTFADGIKRMTRNGVDVVLNCLSGEALKSTWACIAPFGRFIEIGKKDIEENTRIDMAPFIRNVVFASVDLTVIFRQRKTLGAELLNNVMVLLREGKIRCVSPIKTFSFSQIEEAFRYMQTGKHMGKIVLVPQEDDQVLIAPRRNGGPALTPDGTYLVVGGFGGLGRSILRWMALHGARNFIVISRSGPASDAAMATIDELTAAGCQVHSLCCDITDRADLERKLAASLQQLPALRGIIQAAMVLEDRIFDNMPLEIYTRVVRPKVHGSWNIHQVTLGQPLDFFVMLASAAGMVGDTSQGNYAAANAFEDALAHHRIAHGLPATTIDLGLVRSIGYVAENQGAAERNLMRWGFLQIEEDEFLSLMDIAVSNSRAQITTGVGTQELFDRSESEVPHWFRNPVFSHLHQMRARTFHADSAKGPSLPDCLRESGSFVAAVEIILAAVVDKLSKSLMISLDDIDTASPTSAYGVDSLVAVEVRNWVFREMKADIPVFEILQAPSLQALANGIAEKSQLLDSNGNTAQNH